MNTFQDRNIRVSLEERGVLVATIDMPGRSMNVFSADMMDSLDRLIDWAGATGDVTAVVVTSGKTAFFAGADLDMVRDFTERARRDTPAALHRLCGRLGRIFRRVELSRKPYVAAVPGLALGGGLELALACHRRLLADQGLVGLPEVKLGLLPGAGGTQRLPRLVGRRAALTMMLTGEAQSAAAALALGIADEVLPAAGLMSAACCRAAALAGRPASAPWDRPDWQAPGGVQSLDSGDVDAFTDSLGITREQRRLYPAYDAILSCVMGGASLPMDAACDWEMDRFVELIRNPVAGNMIRSLFLDRQRAAKLIPPAPSRQARVAILGNGAAAAGAAELFKASRIDVVSGAQSDSIAVLTEPVREPPSQALAWLRLPTDAPHGFGVSEGVWVSDATSHGRVVEVSLDSGSTEASLGLELARWLRATPLVTRGSPLLPRLAAVQALKDLTYEERLLAVSLEAARAWCEGLVGDISLSDSAAVIAGLHPPHTGGPFEYLRQRGPAAIRLAAAESLRRHGALFALPDRFDAVAAALEESH